MTTFNAGKACATCPPEEYKEVMKQGIYSQQIKLYNNNEVSIPLENTPYYIRIEKNKHIISGKTDDKFLTERIYTKEAENIRIVVGRDAGKLQRRKSEYITNAKSSSTKTALNKPTYEVEYSICGYDYISVVAARTEGPDYSLSGVTRGFSAPIGNQYMFINQGIRQLGEYPATTPDYKIQRILVVFTLGYTNHDIKVINQYTQDKGGRIVYVRNSDELVQFLSERKSKKRLIKQLDIFSHGIILNIPFHFYAENIFSGYNDPAGDFTLEKIMQIDEKIFDYDAIVTSYACRTGIAVDEDDFTNTDPGYEHSLAQLMADTWEVEVRAFAMRSHYGKTYGTKTEINEAEKHRKEIMKYDEDYDYYVNNKHLNPKLKEPTKPQNYEKYKQQIESIKARDENIDQGGPIDPHGAWHKPGTAESPKGLPKGLRTYLPKIWE
ncbi:hypothetical protein [Photorhabdus asymbiotica]|uniref:hypothetical protein n=1 Tax=Photorhabdus asymbiotica TaxID=291112 RepID=UPI003DA709FB